MTQKTQEHSYYSLINHAKRCHTRPSSSRHLVGPGPKVEVHNLPGAQSTEPFSEDLQLPSEGSKRTTVCQKGRACAGSPADVKNEFRLKHTAVSLAIFSQVCKNFKYISNILKGRYNPENVFSIVLVWLMSPKKINRAYLIVKSFNTVKVENKITNCTNGIS